MFHDRHKQLFKQCWDLHVSELASAYLTHGDSLIVLVILVDDRENPTSIIRSLLRLMTRNEVTRELPEPEVILSSWDQVLSAMRLPLVLHVGDSDGYGYSEILGISKQEIALG